jgi:hypothetical protein
MPMTTAGTALYAPDPYPPAGRPKADLYEVTPETPGNHATIVAPGHYWDTTSYMAAIRPIVPPGTRRLGDRRQCCAFGHSSLHPPHTLANPVQNQPMPDNRAQHPAITTKCLHPLQSGATPDQGGTQIKVAPLAPPPYAPKKDPAEQNSTTMPDVPYTSRAHRASPGDQSIHLPEGNRPNKHAFDLVLSESPLTPA